MNPPVGPALEIGQAATLACLLEATIPKPGNVHRGADFENARFEDFVVSAVAIGPAMQTASAGVGSAVHAAVRATQSWVGHNTNLGTILLLAPLAAVPPGNSLEAGVARVLDRLDARDAREVYAAIRLAQPGGLGEVDAMDVAETPPPDLLAAMRAAADRDLVAAQYVRSFANVLQDVAEPLAKWLDAGAALQKAVVRTHVRLLARYGDSLIARKCGLETSNAAQARAAQAERLGEAGDDEGYWREVADLDFWLRCDGHRRNPGTTADLIAAGLFVLLRDGRLRPPLWPTGN